MAKKAHQCFLLVQEVEAERFEQAVNGNMTAGWKLYGPPFSHNGALVQAMTFCDGKKSCNPS